MTAFRGLDVSARGHLDGNDNGDIHMRRYSDNNRLMTDT
jgi:hypothetical protein